jgi:hypothetical protein
MFGITKTMEQTTGSTISKLKLLNQNLVPPHQKQTGCILLNKLRWTAMKVRVTDNPGEEWRK